MHNAIRVSILRDAQFGDCTNNGVTSVARGVKTAILIGVRDGYLTKEDAQPGEPVLQIYRRKIGREEYVVAIPIGVPSGLMFGGNFIYSCDSRFRESVCAYPIAVHDRVEL